MSDLRELNDVISRHIATYLESKKQLEGFTEDERLNAFISGMQEIRGLVIDAYEQEVNERVSPPSEVPQEEK